jgi:hypothetical protein
MTMPIIRMTKKSIMLETQLVEEGVTPQITHENNFNLILSFSLSPSLLKADTDHFFQLGNSPSLWRACINVLPFLTNAALSQVITIEIIYLFSVAFCVIPPETFRSCLSLR